MTLKHVFLFLFWFLVLAGCGVQRPVGPDLGEVYVGPATLNLHQDLSPKSAVTATAKHGDRLAIVESKRRFIKVRTRTGQVGWTDSRQLLTPEQMAQLHQLADRAEHLPTEGVASASDVLNVHTEPTRTSPSFVQIPEGGKMDVVGHQIAPRVGPVTATPRLIVPKLRPTRRRRDRQTSSSKLPPLPPPPTPKPPSNWLEMSRTAPEPEPDASETKNAKPVAMDDWTLIRLKDGKTGWVLSRMLNMAIPDEVAQYSEGHRITSYFPLGDVDDDGQVKHNWLWTTIGKDIVPYEFDSFRVFVWSRKHHRYETAYIERSVTGRYPVHVNAKGASPSFTLILQDEDGKWYRKTYVFEGYRVQMRDKQPYDQGAPFTVSTPSVEAKAAISVDRPQPAKPSSSWIASVKEHLQHLFH